MFARVIAACVVIAFMVPVAAALTSPSWATSVGLDVLNASTFREELSTATKESRTLDDESAEVYRRIEVKDVLIQNLIAGRATLAETTAQFLVLDENRPGYMTILRTNHPGATDEEKMAHNVVGYTIPALNERSLTQRIAVIVRLEVELHQFVSVQSLSSKH